MGFCDTPPNRFVLCGLQDSCEVWLASLLEPFDPIHIKTSLFPSFPPLAPLFLVITLTTY